MVDKIHYRWDFVGLSTDVKPTPATSPKVVDGSTYYCSDNSKLYVFYKDTWYERKPLGGGGGGGSYTAGTGINITDDTISVDTTTIQEKLTAGTNVTISDNTISATDTTYSNFTGTDGTAAGVAGLVPAPSTTDAGKFLKADGTWDTAGGGSGPTVVQTTGTSTTDVMSQNATSSMVYADPANKRRIQLGVDAVASADNAVAIGREAQSELNKNIAIGYGARATTNVDAISIGNTLTTGRGAISIGGSMHGTHANSYTGSVGLGYDAKPTAVGQVMIGTTSDGVDYGYNHTQYRLLSGLYDPQSAHDAATKGYVDGKILSGAGAPTTSTTGTVGQVYQDTTNGKLYICTAIVPGTAPDPDTYTWTEVGAGGSGPTVVQTTGTSTTDVMSQNATTSMVFADPATKQKILIGSGASSSSGADSTVTIGNGAHTYSNNSISIGNGANCSSANGVAIGASADASAASVAIGRSTSVNQFYSVALGAYSAVLNQGEVSIGGSQLGTNGYNGSQYRLLTNVYDPQSAHDAATKGYVDPTTDSSAPTTATVGRLGQIQIDTTNADAYMCVAVDTVTPSYTWKKINA